MARLEQSDERRPARRPLDGSARVGFRSFRTYGYHCSSPSLSFRVDLTGHCAEGGGSEVLMQVTRSLSARIRKWLGLLGRKPAKTPYGAGAWGR